MIFVGLVVLVIGLAFLVQGAPYVTSNDHDSEEIFKFVKKYRPKHVLDMGSGNGKLVIMLARNGFKADGIELNPLLVWQSRRNIKKLGLSDKARIRWGSFWKYDVSEYDLITMYAIQHIMSRLETKLSRELKPGSIVVSNYFTFPVKKPFKTAGRIRIYKF